MFKEILPYWTIGAAVVCALAYTTGVPLEIVVRVFVVNLSFGVVVATVAHLLFRDP